jgi:hypothetical protein
MGKGSGSFRMRCWRRYFGLKEEEATGDCRKFHSEIHVLYSSPNGWVEIWRVGGKKDMYTEMCWKARSNENILKTCA